jgi:hypothetical protein
MNVFTTLNDGKQVITIPKTLTGKTITLGLTHDDTTQNCSQDELSKIFDDLENVNKDGGHVSLSVINKGALIMDNKSVETINKLDFGQNGMYYRLTIANESNIPRQPETQSPEINTYSIVCLNCMKCG